jgi:hypothetical protein
LFDEIHSTLNQRDLLERHFLAAGQVTFSNSTLEDNDAPRPGKNNTNEEKKDALCKTN